MHRQPLLTLLQQYTPFNEKESAMHAQIIAFVQKNPDCFERSLSIGHITGSAWIVNETGDKVLLTHHRKLDRWLQLGGHADGETDVFRVALTEATEESGLRHIRAVSREIFDVDVHEIPARGTVEAHLHYDIRFLFRADEAELLTVPERESKGLQWIPLAQVTRLNGEESVARMVAKTQRQHPE